MKPIRIDDYCFDRIHVWVQYDKEKVGFIELVIEVFYPVDRQAEGLVMFNHGFLIGNNLLYYLEKLTSPVTGNNPLFGINPSTFYNYSTAIVEKNWALAFVSASHAQVEGMPWLDFGGNPRVGQDAYAAASYLIKYGATDFFFKIDDYRKSRDLLYMEEIKKNRFMKDGCNNVIFAGHSVGGAHAQVAACGFKTLQEIGAENSCTFDPVMFDREILPRYSDRMSDWDVSDRANPVGLLQFSPVDQQIPFLVPGMKPYREALAKKPLPNLMIVGDCDCTALGSNFIQKPPAWSADPKKRTQFSEQAPEGSDSWAVVANVERGSHCGYLTDKSIVCNKADEACTKPVEPGKEPYKSREDEALFSAELLRRFIDSFSGVSPFGNDSCKWLKSDFLKWLNQPNPYRSINMVPFRSGGYIDYSGKSTRCKP